MMKQNSLQILSILVLSSLSLVFLVYAGDANRAVATLNGESLEAAKLPSEAGRMHIEATSPKSADLAARDVAVLIDWVLEKRKEKAAKAYGITVSDDELQQKVRDILKDKSDYVDKTNETLARLPKALREAQSRPDQADRIFEEQLKGYMPYGLWKQHLAANYTDEDIAKFEKHQPLAEEDLRTVEAPVRKMLLDRKLIDKVAAMAEASTNRETAWRMWCAQQIKSSDVVIHDTELKRNYEQAVKALARSPGPDHEFL